MAPDLLSIIQSEIDARLIELKPLLAEYERLLVAVEALLESDVASIGDSAHTEARAARRTTLRPASRDSVTARRLGPTSPGPTNVRGATDAKAPTENDKTSPSRGVTGAQAPTDSGKTSPGPPPHEVARGGILAALEHGSHTADELLIVTAMSAPNIKATLRGLVSEGMVAKTERDGKVAYVLPLAA